MRTAPKKRGLDRGLTLVELMVAVAIVAVLATIAVVSYKKHIQRARVTEGMTFLMDVKMKQETYFSTYSQYVSTGTSHNDFFPAKAAFLGAPQRGKYAFWDWDCNLASPSTAVAGLCALGLLPTGDVVAGQTGFMTRFQYTVVGWSPAQTYNAQPPYIFRPNTRWWFGLGRTFWNEDGSEGIELRVSNESATIGEVQF